MSLTANKRLRWGQVNSEPTRPEGGICVEPNRAAIVKMRSGKAVNEDTRNFKLGFTYKIAKVDVFGKYCRGKTIFVVTGHFNKSAKLCIVASFVFFRFFCFSFSINGPVLWLLLCFHRHVSDT